MLYIILMHISHYVFFFLLMTYYLMCIYFKFILDYVNYVRHKQIWAIFSFELKMGQKAAETTVKISNTFDPRTGNEHTGQWWFK